MPDIQFVLPDGRIHGLEAPEGVSLMQVATGAGVEGILAECGGSMACATCHVYVDPAWVAAMPPALDDELEMLACTAAPRREHSRLSCQIRITWALHGLVVQLPECQR